MTDLTVTASHPSGSDVDRFRAQVQQFLREHLPSEWKGLGALSAEQRAGFLPAWRRLLVEHRYIGASWPPEYGGAGLPLTHESVLQEEFVRRGAPTLPGACDVFGINLIGPTLLHRGTPEQRRAFLPRILNGDCRFAQGFSEPEAGSDLFSLQTRARLEDDGWVINGRKIWQTAGDVANWLFVMVRTEPDQRRAAGLSMLLVPMEQPGVTVRPIKTMTGKSEFCEIGFDDARTAAGNIVGQRGEGASVAKTLLGFERGAGSGALYWSYRIELERLVRLAREHGRQDDPLVRQKLAWCHSRVESIRHLGWRTLERAVTGSPPNEESSIMKLVVSTYHARATELAMDILGPAALVRSGAPGMTTVGPDWLGSPNSPNAWQHYYLTARAATIYGGSSQVQRDIIAERILSLPRDTRSNSQRAENDR
jgi:hypothetical protein